MNVAGGQGSICGGMAFGAYTEKKHGETYLESTNSGFFQLLKQTGCERQEDVEKESASAVEEAKKCVSNYRTTLVKEILFGSSNKQYWNEKRNNKKYRLFQADNGVFGDKTLLDLVNPSENKRATWNSAESKKLTRDQARYLKEKYNITNLSDEEYNGLLMELVDMQILSREEAERLFACQELQEAAQSGYGVMDKEVLEKRSIRKSTL